MAYIYKIINDINKKVYIGKTERTIEIRWKEHQQDYKKESCQNRPLYKAFNKYGIENFHIELIEECNNPEERERYWIEYYGSFKYGYNATLGGDGKPYIDYDLIYSLYKEGLYIKEIAKIIGCNQFYCSQILSTFGITKEERLKRQYKLNYKPVAKLDKYTEEIIDIYPSVTAAQKEIGNKHVTCVCNGKRKTAGGYKWKFL